MLKPPKTPMTADDPKLGFYLTSAVTEYDRRQEARATKTRRSHNIYALSHYLGAIEEITAKIKAGTDVRAAVIAHIHGGLGNFVLRAIGHPPMTDAEQRF